MLWKPPKEGLPFYMNYKKLRLSKGWSRTMLAFAAGVSVDVIIRLETGKNVKPENVERIKEALLQTVET
jgi:predicted transcriptional regulator